MHGTNSELMRRGFKTWCESTSERYRTALGLRPQDLLDPEDLAAHLGVMVRKPEEVPGLASDSLQQLIDRDPDSWSAVTIRHDDTDLTIVNSAHAPNRRRSSLTHELAHLILDHGPGRIDVSPEGHLLLNSFEQEQEEEADWLTGTLLVPRAGLIIAYRSSQDPEVLSNRFGVSADMLNWRLRMTGVATQARRARNWSRRTAPGRS